MTVEDKFAGQDPSVTGQFLFSKTKPARTTDERVTMPERMVEGPPAEEPEGVSTFDPGEALEACQRFAVLYLGIDSAGNEKSTLPEKSWQEQSALLAAAVAAVLAEQTGHWGGLAAGHFGIFLPDKSGAEGEDLGKKILAEFNQRSGGDSLIGGVAEYPTLDYTPAEIQENARKAHEHACFFGPGSIVCFDAVSLNISGDGYYGKGELGLAIDEYEKALRLDPTNANVHNSLGVCYGVMGDLAKALSCFESAINGAPDEVMAQYNAGLVHALKDESDRALEIFLGIGNGESDPFELVLETGKLYIDRQEAETALPYLQRALEMNPQSGRAHRLMGNYHFLKGNDDAAVVAFQKAVKLNPNDAYALSSLGHLFHKKGENSEISEIFMLQSVDILPTNGLFNERLAEFYLDREKWEEARRYYDRAREYGCDNLQQRIAELGKGAEDDDLARTG